jgi:hypothetical protein
MKEGMDMGDSQLKARIEEQNRLIKGMSERIKELESLAVVIDGNTYYPRLSYNEVRKVYDPEEDNTSTLEKVGLSPMNQEATGNPQENKTYPAAVHLLSMMPYGFRFPKTEEEREAFDWANHKFECIRIDIPKTEDVRELQSIVDTIIEALRAHKLKRVCESSYHEERMLGLR